MKYNQILKEMTEFEPEAESEFDPTDAYETDVAQFTLGTEVSIHIDSFDMVVDGIEELDRENVKQKLIDGETAIIFNEDGDSADVVFRDGAEIMNVPFSALTAVNATEEEPEEPEFTGSIKLTDFF